MLSELNDERSFRLSQLSIDPVCLLIAKICRYSSELSARSHSIQDSIDDSFTLFGIFGLRQLVFEQLKKLLSLFAVMSNLIDRKFLIFFFHIFSKLVDCIYFNLFACLLELNFRRLSLQVLHL